MLNFTQHILYFNTVFTSSLGINVLEKSAICSSSNYFLMDFLITNFSLNNISPTIFLFQSISLLEINNIVNNNFVGIVGELFFLTSLSILFFNSMFMFEDYKNFAKPKNFSQNSGLQPIYYLIINSLLVNVYTIFFKVFALKQDLQFIFNSMFSVDLYTILAKIFILIGSSLVLIITLNSWFCLHYTQHISTYDYLFLLNFLNLSLYFLISATDFFTLYLALESLSFCLYTLVVFKSKDKLTTEAGIKYFSLGALASGFLLFGISLIYGNNGTLNFISLKQVLDLSFSYNLILTTNLLNYLALIFLISGFLFKLGAFPYHMGLLDVYEGSPLIITLYLISVVKFGLLVVFFKLLMFVFYSAYYLWSPILAFFALGSLLFGSIAAILQQRLKRFFAYSSIHQIGYLLLSLSTGTLEGLSASLTYAILYLLSTLSFLGMLVLLNSTLSISSNKNYKTSVVYFSDLKQISHKSWVYIIIFSFTLFSLANLPPFAGFFVKFYIFKAVLACDITYIMWIAVPSILTSILSTFYYLRLFKLIFFEALFFSQKNLHFNKFTWVQVFTNWLYQIYLKQSPVEAFYSITVDLALNKQKANFIIITKLASKIILSVLVTILLIYFYLSNFLMGLVSLMVISCLSPTMVYEFSYFIAFLQP
jgi:NADH-quinone oxidoreductase subunit N